MDITEKEFEEKLNAICKMMKDLLIEKNKSYGGPSLPGTFEWAISGNCHRPGDKHKRYVHLIQKLLAGKEPVTINETLIDSLRDIFGYAVIGMIILDNEEHFLPKEEK